MFLRREVTLSGAILLGLGSIVGTGVFVSMGLAAGIAGMGMLYGLFLAAALAICNGLSTAQLAAAYPVSGGTYEFGYRYLKPWLGIAAGWLFIIAKSASAATATLGFGGYLIQLLSLENFTNLQLGSLALVTVVALSIAGIRKSVQANAVFLAISLSALALFIFTSSSYIEWQRLSSEFISTSRDEMRDISILPILHASALLFVAYTGYGRIATLGDEIINPQRNIPRAVIITLIVSFSIYLLVAVVALGTVGAQPFYTLTLETAAPLESIALALNNPITAKLLSVGALAALFGVLLNLILGLSRVLYAMARNGDMPRLLARIHPRLRTPDVATLTVGVFIFVLCLFQNIKITWSLSAAAVLAYYAITNVAALRMSASERLYPRVISWFGLIGCIALLTAISFKHWTVV